ncbi:TPA: hypothetical protein ACOTHR_003000 [Clostridium perfringens]
MRIKSQGFKIIDFIEGKLILEEALCNNKKQRMIHYLNEYK